MGQTSPDNHVHAPEAPSVEAGALGSRLNPPAVPSGEHVKPLAGNLDFVMDVPVELTVEIGRRKLRIGELLRLGPGSVLELSKASGESLDVYVNERLIARGEAVVVGERYGVRLTEVLTGEEGRNGRPSEP
jgi:flagellar motor switch protein FliN/FliY